MATNFQLSSGFSLPSIDYTLTKPVDPVATIGKGLALGSKLLDLPNEGRARQITGQQQKAVMGGDLEFMGAKVSPEGGVAGEYQDPALAETNRSLGGYKAQNIQNQIDMRTLGTTGRLAQGDERLRQGLIKLGFTEAQINSAIANNESAINARGQSPGKIYNAPVRLPRAGGGGSVPEPDMPTGGWEDVPNLQDDGGMDAGLLPPLPQNQQAPAPAPAQPSTPSAIRQPEFKQASDGSWYEIE